MTTITTRSGKGSPLTNNEVDANFTNLNDDKVETSGDSMTGNLSFGDNNKAIFGAGSDLQIYHDGANSYIDDAGSGVLFVRGNSQVILGKYTGERMFEGNADGSSYVFYDNSVKLATSSTGIDVTGSVVSDGLTVNGDVLFEGNVNDVIVNSSTNNYPFYVSRGVVKTEALSMGVDDSDAILNSIQDERYGGYKFQSTYSGTGTRTRMQIGQNTGDISFYDSAGTSPAFYWDASESRLGLGTTAPSNSLHVSGTASTPALFERTGSTGAYIGLKDNSGSLVYLGDNNGTFEVQTAGSSYATKLAVTSAGNVGIGETNPAEELHISAAVPTLRLQDSDGTNQYSNIVHSNGLLFLYARNGSSYGTFNFVGDDGTTQSTFSQITENAIQQFHSSAWYIRNRYDGGSLNFGVETSAGALYYPIQLVGSSNIIKFENASGEMARFTTDGRLGLGTTSPSALLHLKSNAPYITFEDDDNNQDWQIQATASFAIRDQSADQERMRIDSSGRVQVAKTSQVYTTVGVQLGTYSSNSIDNTTQFTHNNSGGTSVACTAPVSESCITFHRQDTGAFMGHIRNDSSNSVSYFTSSDERLKENIVDAPSASDDIDAIQVRSFDWKADGSHQKYGVIAQELNNVIPSAVDMTQDENRHASVDLSKLVPMLVKEIQSLRARVAQLETN